MKHLTRIHLIHVAGSRMISQGTDDVSRGEMASGVMRGAAMLLFVPLHLSAMDRVSGLLSWVHSWLGLDAELLSPEDWFERGQDIVGWKQGDDDLDMPVIKQGKWIWAPPPAAAGVAVDLLRLARLKRGVSTHVFICPKLMLPLWR